MGSKSIPHAAVIGAGIAGLSAAISLQRAGWDVEIYERSTFKNEIGAAITVSPNATRVLEKYGFDFEKAGAVPLQARHFYHGDSLETFDRSEFSDIDKECGRRAWAMHRVDLHNGLKDVALESDGDKPSHQVKLRLGVAINEIDPDQGIVKLPDGKSIKKDLIVVADGVKSNLVQYVNNSAGEPVNIGRSVYRALIPMERFKTEPELWSLYQKDDPSGFVGFMVQDPHVMIVSYQCRNSQMMNVAVVHDTHHGQGDEDLWHAPAKISDLEADIEPFHPRVKKILNLLEGGDLAVYHLRSRKPLSSFVRGKAIVIGDAAHAMLPTHAAAGGLAIESGAFLEVLFKGLAAEDSAEIEKRILLFDKLRVPRCNLTMILSNEGPFGLYRPNTVEAIRQFYDGHILPKEKSFPWSPDMRQFLFKFDAYAEAEEALARQ